MVYGYDPTAMTLFLSDLHLGRGTASQSRAVERALVALLDHYADQAEALYLVGDVFDQYVEYKHLAPKGAARFLGRLADWTDRGKRVVYVLGNRDPWHGGFFSSELGVRMISDGLTAVLHGRRVYIAHGDALVPEDRVYQWLRPVLRHPLALRLYRAALPADWGYGLARRVGRRAGGPDRDPTAARALHRYAQHALGQADLVVLGHCHQATLTAYAGGSYLNPGFWFADRTFGTLDASGPALHRWADHHALRLA